MSQLFQVLTLLAEAEGGEPGGAAGLVTLMPIVLILVLYFVLIQRPNKREQAVRQTMLKSIKKNDRVITTAGIYGVVTSVQADADEVTIRVDEANNTKLRMSLGAVARVLGDDNPAEKEVK